MIAVDSMLGTVSVNERLLKIGLLYHQASRLAIVPVMRPLPTAPRAPDRVCERQVGSTPQRTRAAWLAAQTKALLQVSVQTVNQYSYKQGDLLLTPEIDFDRDPKRKPAILFPSEIENRHQHRHTGTLITLERYLPRSARCFFLCREPARLNQGI